jgi:parallel beta-helix repeat protein
MRENTIQNNAVHGVILAESDGNTIRNNTIEGNGGPAGGVGLILSNSDNNEVYNNNFIDNLNQGVGDVGGSGNIFNLPVPDGGNYWSDFDEASEGCEDTAPADGFCDAPKLFLGGIDNLPWVIAPHRV